MNFRNYIAKASLTVPALLTAALSACGGGSSQPSLGPAGPLNDTGRSQCSAGHEGGASSDCPVPGAPGQDAEYGRDALALRGQLIKVGGGDAGFDFSKIASNGMPLAAQTGVWRADGSAAQGSYWQCVRDNTSGLTWEVKHSEAQHPQFGGSTYSWYTADEERNAGLPGILDGGNCNAGRCDSDGYVAYVNSIKLCGYDNWRLPTVAEFLSIAHYGREHPAIDEHYFPNIGEPRFWSADQVANAPPNAWYVYFSDASISFTSKTNHSHLRLVRSAAKDSQ